MMATVAFAVRERAEQHRPGVVDEDVGSPSSARSCSAAARIESRSVTSAAIASALLPSSAATLHRPSAHATINGSSSCQNISPCEPMRSVITTSAPALRSAVAHRVAFSRKKGSRVLAMRYARGSELGITLGGL